jgi:hypothetical protein
VAVTASDDIFVADSGNQRVMLYTGVALGIWNATVVAGVGPTPGGHCPAGVDPTSVPATEACFAENAIDIAIDWISGRLYIADSVRNMVFSLDDPLSGTGHLTPLVGPSSGVTQTTQPNGYCGDGGPAEQACLSSPQGIAVDYYGNLLITDSNANRVCSRTN